MPALLTRLLEAGRRFRNDRKGVGAVEFALIAPVMIVLYIGSLEISVAMSVNKKVARASSTISDLVTQEGDVDKAFLKDMIDVAESVITPFRIDNLRVNITGIEIDSSGLARVAWSWNENNGRPYAAGSLVSIPAQLVDGNTFLVRTELAMDYPLLLVLPGLEDVDVKKLNLSKTTHMRPRIEDEITCSDC